MRSDTGRRPGSRAAVVRGLGATVPEKTVTNAMLAARLDTSDEWIVSRTGIHERHVVEHGVSTGDLAVEAGRRALKSAQVDDVDLVLLATSTPDFPCPGTAPDVATRLGLDRRPAFDLAAVCSGFVYGAAIGAAAVTSGLAESVLVIGAEAFTTIVDPRDRNTAVIFGDGAGAFVLSAGEVGEPGAIEGVDLGSDGALSGAIRVAAGGSRQRSGGPAWDPADHYFAMQGQVVFRHAVTSMSKSAAALLAAVGWDVASVDRFVGHQANVRILHSVADALGVDRERVVVHLDRVGNTSAASIPLALADAADRGQLHTGDRVLMSAFGGGATWGSAAMTWPAIDVIAA